MPLIGFGNYNKNYIYIVLAICCGLFNNTLSQINYYTAFQPLRLLPTEDQEKYSNHGLIHQIFYYFGTFIISIIFSKSEIGESKKEKSKIKKKESKDSKDKYIYIGMEEYLKISSMNVWLVMFLWVLIEQVIEKYNCIFSHLDFWMIELMIISYLSSKILKIQTYKHQKFVLYFNLVPILFKIATIILSFKGVEDDKSTNKFLDNNGNLKLIYINYPFLMIIGIIFYSPLMATKSYVYVKIKYFMDSKYISENTLLKLYGLIGTIFYTLIGIISTIFKCKEDNDNKNFFDYFCNIVYENNKYFENFISFFTTSTSIIEILIEIIAVFLGMISFYFYKFYLMKVVKFLTPVHLIFLTPIYYFFFKVILIIYNIFYLIFHEKGKFLDDSEMKYTIPKFFLDVSGDVYCFFGFLIYLEIIELYCFNLSYNSRKSIDQRGRLESSNISDDKIIYLDNLNNSDDEDNDDNEDNNECLNKEK